MRIKDHDAIKYLKNIRQLFILYFFAYELSYKNLIISSSKEKSYLKIIKY